MQALLIAVIGGLGGFLGARYEQGYSDATQDADIAKNAAAVVVLESKLDTEVARIDTELEDLSAEAVRGGRYSSEDHDDYAVAQLRIDTQQSEAITRFMENDAQRREQIAMLQGRIDALHDRIDVALELMRGRP